MLLEIVKRCLEFFLGAAIIYAIFFLFDHGGSHIGIIAFSFLIAGLHFALSPIGLLIIVICALIKQQNPEYD